MLVIVPLKLCLDYINKILNSHTANPEGEKEYETHSTKWRQKHKVLDAYFILPSKDLFSFSTFAFNFESSHSLKDPSKLLRLLFHLRKDFTKINEFV